MKNITVVVLTFNTPENIIMDCLSSINNDIKVLIIENSNKFIHEEKILSKFDNVNVKCTGKNLGYGGGNNGSNSSNANKSSGAEGFEDRSYGNSSDNSEYENGRSRRKRGVSNESNASNETI